MTSSLIRKVAVLSGSLLLTAQLASAAEDLASTIEIARKLSPFMPLASTLILDRVGVAVRVETKLPDVEPGSIQIVMVKRTADGRTLASCADSTETATRSLERKAAKAREAAE